MSTKTSRQTEEQAPGFSPELLDELLGEAKTAQELLGSSGIPNASFLNRGVH